MLKRYCELKYDIEAEERRGDAWPLPARLGFVGTVQYSSGM